MKNHIYIMGDRFSGAFGGIQIYEKVQHFSEKVQNSAISVSAIRAFPATVFIEKAPLPMIESENSSKTVIITTRNRLSDFSTNGAQTRNVVGFQY